VIVVQRFEVPEDQAVTFRHDLEAVLDLLSRRPGFVAGEVGRNVDDPGLWLLHTTWEGPGAYRRALSSYDVKVGAWPLLSRALDEPSAYEVLRPGAEPNHARPRGE
jgi:quinol monooxygenase YgiN